MFASMALPCLLAQMIHMKRPLLTANHWARTLVAVAVVTQLAGNQFPTASTTLVPASFAIGTLALGAVLWSSSRRVLPVVFGVIGGLANTIPIAVHGAMPVRASGRTAIEHADYTEPALIAAKHARSHFEVTFADPVSLLGDWIDVSALRMIVSPGDVLLIAGFMAVGVVHLLQARDEKAHTACGVAAG